MRGNSVAVVLSAGLSLWSLITSAQPEVTYHGRPSFLRRSADPSGDYCRLVIPGHHFTSETGKPEMPVYSRIIEVEEGTRISFIISDVVTSRVNFADNNMKGMQIYPAQPARTKNELPDEKVVIKDKKLYNSRKVIGHDTVVFTTIGKFRGRELVNMAIYPAFYNPSSGYVDLITSMKIRLTYGQGAVKGSFSDEGADLKGVDGAKLYITGYSEKPVSMVIITDSVFSKYIQPLIRWKTMKGIRVTAIYPASGPDGDVYAALKDTLASIYQTSNDSGYPLQYLLIVGDRSVIPTSQETSNVSDLYYGEFDGNGDYIPEIYTGRIPVKDTTKLKSIIKRIIDYENFNYLPDNTFWSDALVSAGNEERYQNHMNGQVDYIFNNYFKPDPTINGYRWLYPDAPAKDDSLKLLFNKGLSILNYTGHGEAGGFSDPTFKVNVIPELNNENRYPLIIANACRTAQISVTPCFGTEITTTPDKGAIGYIGCTNDSYWTEDFYWAVGPGKPDTSARYSNTGLGAFDRFFHTHGEDPGDWYYTLGQINFAGNLAVSASTSPRKKYYWETYMLLGDPSLIPHVGKPDTFNINLPDSLPQELENLFFTSEPFSYAAISDFDTLWDARFTSPSGNVTLAIPPGIKDSCLVIVTGQNMVPLKKTIYFGSVSGEFITTLDIVYDDIQGNGNYMPDYGEKINLRVTIKNLGAGAATNLRADLSVLMGMLTVEQGTAIIGTLNGGATYTIDNKFIFKVSDEVEDGDLASLLLTLTDDNKVYNSGVDMTLRAPENRIIASVPDDIGTGNANYLPDAGETILVKVRVINDGTSETSGIISLLTDNPYITVPVNEITTGILEPGIEQTLSFEASISPLAISGTTIRYDIDLVCGKYTTSSSFSLKTGKTRETWEHNRFDVFPWIRPQNYPWIITESSAYENVLSARSSPIPNSAESVIAIWVNTPEKDTVSFFTRVSSEADFDKFIFRIDSVENLSISGEVPWAMRTAILSPGLHYLEWVYNKDVSLTGGLDAAWLDLVTFPDVSFLDADLQVDTVYPPELTEPLTNFTVRGNVVNLGRNTLTSFPLAYRINNGEAVNETFYLKIDPGDTLRVSFNQKVNLQPNINYKITLINKLPEDGYHKNDTAFTTFIRTDTDDPWISDGILIISPNPFTSMINVDYTAYGDGQVRLEITDGQGRIVYSRNEEVTPGKVRIPLNCSGLAGGVYVLRITEGTRVVTRKIVKAE